MNPSKVGIASWLVTALACAGWALLTDWWATTDDAVSDALREARWRLDEQDAAGAVAALSELRPLFDGGEAVALDGDPYLPIVFETITVPAWRPSADAGLAFASLDAEAEALAARYAALTGGRMAPLVRALGALDRDLYERLPYDPLPPARRWVIYERADADASIDVPDLVRVSRANFEIPEALRAEDVGADVGFALVLARVTELTGEQRPPIRIGDITLPSFGSSRTVTWWLLGRTEPIEVWGVYATVGVRSDAEMAAEMLAERTERHLAGAPAGTAARPPKVGNLMENLCVSMGKPPSCYLTGDFSF